MKYLLWVIFIITASILAYGIATKSTTNPNAIKFIGAGILGIFFVWMPLFLYHRYKGKKVTSYMITEETFKKIKEEADTFLD